MKDGASEKAGLFAASPRPTAPRKGSGFDWAVGFPLLSLPELKLGIGTLKLPFWLYQSYLINNPKAISKIIVGNTEDTVC